MTFLLRITCLVLLAACGCSYIGVRVDSPLAQQIGINLRGYTVAVSNNTPLYGRVVVYDKEVGALGPGDAISDNRRWEPLAAYSPEIPVLALFYADPEMTRYVGAAAHTLRVSQYQPNASWIIGRYDVRTTDGSPLPDALAQTELRASRKAFPRETWNAASTIQIVNNSPYRCTVRVNGANRIVLGTGDAYFANARNFGFYGRELDIQLVFADTKNNLLGTADRHAYVPAQGILAFQWIAGTADIRR